MGRLAGLFDLVPRRVKADKDAGWRHQPAEPPGNAGKKRRAHVGLNVDEGAVGNIGKAEARAQGTFQHAEGAGDGYKPRGVRAGYGQDIAGKGPPGLRLELRPEPALQKAGGRSVVVAFKVNLHGAGSQPTSPSRPR